MRRWSMVRLTKVGVRVCSGGGSAQCLEVFRWNYLMIFGK
ncbi:hypothetical protein M758_11G024600 [Ceratodon purpureus]|uniref:Uncharacterized protein n=1 Tax=Ceratodon purpureus TaxID=3225 RepID=A0A8T0GC57_CERPU|nr:hypothetical protein KC19_11G026700 [Ceratodon purpureus]KAG0600326.1 hypothetical protein M758_11G024600 [Ceratodon purpureus]